MQIKELKFRNIGAYGNKLQTIKFEKEGSLNLLTGKNGHGKCVHPDTIINIKFSNQETQKKYEDYTKRTY